MFATQFCTSHGITYTIVSHHIELPESRVHVDCVTVPKEFSLDHSAFDFLSYSPAIFLELRILAGVDDATYLASFTVEDSMMEKFTEGRSGSFFYYTHDLKYIVKTVTVGEKNVLQNSISSYRDYLKSNSDSFLTRFFGLYGIRLDKVQNYIYFVVMENMFANSGGVRLCEVYDLKGSYVNRSSLKHGQNAQTFHGTMKDCDLPELQLFSLGDAVATRIKSQLHLDASWLQGHNIMDYSLLVGIHKCCLEIKKCKLCQQVNGAEDGAQRQRNSGIFYAIFIFKP